MDTIGAVLANVILSALAYEANWRGVRAYDASDHDYWTRTAVHLARAARGDMPRCSVCGKPVHLRKPCEVYQ